MASSLEIGDTVAKTIVLPPEENVLKAAVLAAQHTEKAVKYTLGESVAVIVNFLLAAFPALYATSLSQNRAGSRGIPNNEGKELGWTMDHAGVTPNDSNIIVKSTFALLYHLVRKPQQNPMAQVAKRFNAMYTTVKQGLQPPVVEVNPLFDFKDAAMWLTSAGFGTLIIKSLLELESHSSTGPSGKALIGQVKLVATDAEMTPYMTMKSFINEGLSYGAMLPGVVTEIRAFLQAERELKEHGEELFPYLKAFKLRGHELLAPVRFPNLCKVANTRKRRIDGTFHDYPSTKESLSTLTDKEVEDAVSRPPLKRRGLLPTDMDALTMVYSTTREEVMSITSSPGNQTDADSMLTKIMEALTRKQ